MEALFSPEIHRIVRFKLGIKDYPVFQGRLLYVQE